MSLASAIYVGAVRHRRREPRVHEFRYPLFMMWLDLDELERVFAGRWLWSAQRPAPAWFRRRDFPGDPARPLADVIRDLVAPHTGRRPSGPVRVLTHLRMFGVGFNPVRFYYCFSPDGSEVEAIVAEVRNTPWNERHCYVFTRAAGQPLEFRVPKAFHVSPFMPMEIEHRFRFSPPGEQLVVHIADARDGVEIFAATLALARRPLTGRTLAGVLARFPLVTMNVVLAIYWQALRLWLKRVPLHPHPRDRASAGRAA